MNNKRGHNLSPSAAQNLNHNILRCYFIKVALALTYKPPWAVSWLDKKANHAALLERKMGALSSASPCIITIFRMSEMPGL